MRLSLFQILVLGFNFGPVWVSFRILWVSIGFHIVVFMILAYSGSAPFHKMCFQCFYALGVLASEQNDHISRPVALPIALHTHTTRVPSMDRLLTNQNWTLSDVLRMMWEGGWECIQLITWSTH